MPPPHLPQALQHSHRKCLKRGECTCAERLSLTLGAGDPRLALDRLFERQLKLLNSVRELWRRGEAARGSLPTVPKLPPLPQPPRPDWQAARRGHDADVGSPRASRGGSAARRHGAHAMAHAGSEQVGAYLDGGVLGGLDEGGRMGPTEERLPERLSDLL